MKPTPEELLREFAEKWLDYPHYVENEFYSDLNALLDKLMPTEEEAKMEIEGRGQYAESMGYSYNEVKELKKGVAFGIRWFRSRMKA